MLDKLSTAEKIAGGFLGLLLIAGLIENAPVVLILLAIFGVLYGLRGREGNEQQEDEYINHRMDDYAVSDIATRRPEPVRRERPANSEQIHQHALRAVKRAGLDPNDVQVLPVNIGLVTFKEDSQPVIHVNRPIEDDVDYIQPYVELRVPVTASGKVRFDVFNGSRQRIFSHEDNYDLKRGRNLIMPSARLPIHDEHDLTGRWEMRVTADNVVLARHIFQWDAADSVDFDQYLGEDGEISSELRAVMAASRLEAMSLDELLAHQDEDENAQQASRS